MPEFSESVLAVIDESTDRERASDGHSRYGAYLDQRFDHIRDSGALDDGPEFAALAWNIATAPVMSPGYVRIRPDLLAITAELSEDGSGDLVLRVLAPIPHRTLALAADHFLGRWQDWESDCYDQSPWRSKVEPLPGDRPALTVSAALLVPVPAVHMAPPVANGPGPQLTRDAKRAVALLADQVNHHAAPLLTNLLGVLR